MAKSEKDSSRAVRPVTTRVRTQVTHASGEGDALPEFPDADLRLSYARSIRAARNGDQEAALRLIDEAIIALKSGAAWPPGLRKYLYRRLVRVLNGEDSNAALYLIGPKNRPADPQKWADKRRRWVTAHELARRLGFKRPKDVACNVFPNLDVSDLNKALRSHSDGIQAVSIEELRVLLADAVQEGDLVDETELRRLLGE